MCLSHVPWAANRVFGQTFVPPHAEQCLYLRSWCGLTLLACCCARPLGLRPFLNFVGVYKSKSNYTPKRYTEGSISRVHTLISPPPKVLYYKIKFNRVKGTFRFLLIKLLEALDGLKLRFLPTQHRHTAAPYILCMAVCSSAGWCASNLVDILCSWVSHGTCITVRASAYPSVCQILEAEWWRVQSMRFSGLCPC